MQGKTSSNSASAAINKRLNWVVEPGIVVHSLCDNFIDRLREVEAQSDVAAQALDGAGPISEGISNYTNTKPIML